MLIVTFDYINGEFEWHIGEIVPRNIVGYGCNFIQADGDELQFINETMKNIPVSNRPVQKWRAPFSQFIWDNLPKKYSE